MNKYERTLVLSKKRILMDSSAIGLSHLTRLLLIAREFRDRDAQVAFAFKKKDKLLEQEGYEFFPISDVAITDFSSNIFAAYTPSFVEQCVEEELKVIKAFQPDVIVGDLRMTAAISSRIAKVPYISVVSSYMTDYFNPVDVMIPKEKSALKHAIASITGRGIQAVQKRALATPFRTVARKYGIKNLVSLYDFLQGDLTLLADLPQFCPLANLPKNFRYIGPLIWEGTNGAIPTYLERRNKSQKLIYATTANTGKEKLIQLVVEAFKDDSAYEVVLTTGAYINPNQFPSAGNIHIERFIPGSQVLKHSVAAIHCGSQGTTYQTMAQGVPAVVLPFNNDQRITAWLIKRQKVGIPLSPANLTGRHVKLAVEMLVRDTEIQKKLQYYKDLLSKTNGPQNAAQEIMAFLNQSL